MSVDVNLRTYLLGQSSVTQYLTDKNQPGSIQQNKIDENGPETRIFYTRTGSVNERFLGGSSGIVETTIDLECISPDIDTAFAMAEAVKACLDGLVNNETIGAQAVFVDDHTDDYLIKGAYADEGLHIASLRLSIFHL